MLVSATRSCVDGERTESYSSPNFILLKENLSLKQAVKALEFSGQSAHRWRPPFAPRKIPGTYLY